MSLRRVSTPFVIVFIFCPYAWNEWKFTGCRPEAREGATLTTVYFLNGIRQIEPRAFLFGGFSRGLHSSIFSLRTHPDTGNLIWERAAGEEPLLRRYGHSATAWEYLIVVVGGSRLFNRETKRREVLNDVQVFNTLDGKWSELQCDGAMLEHRRGHAACLVGKHLLVHGGMNNKDQYLSNTLMLTMGRPDRKDLKAQTYKWLRTSVKVALPDRIAYHTCQLVLHPERYRAFENIGVYSLPEIRWVKTRMEYEGVYFFGGRNERGPLNKLFILQVGKKPAEWIEPSVEGTPPVARYGHSMNFYSDRKIIIIFGGRNDENFGNSGKSYLNDVWVLYLEKLCWTFWDKREGLAEPPEERYSHCSTIFQGAILIFGGLSEENYCKSTLHALELEPISKRANINLKKETIQNSLQLHGSNSENVSQTRNISLPNVISLQNARPVIKKVPQLQITPKIQISINEKINILQCYMTEWQFLDLFSIQK